MLEKFDFDRKKQKKRYMVPNSITGCPAVKTTKSKISQLQNKVFVSKSASPCTTQSRIVVQAELTATTVDWNSVYGRHCINAFPHSVFFFFFFFLNIFVSQLSSYADSGIF